MKFYNELELGCNSVKVVDYNQDGFEEGCRQYCFPEEPGTIATREFLENSLAGHENVEADENNFGHVKLTGEVLENSTSAVTSGGVYKAIQTSLTAVMTYKGTLEVYGDLCAKEPYAAVGDVWNIKTTGDNYAWDGSGWDKLAGTFDVSTAIEAHNKDSNAHSCAIGCAVAKHNAEEGAHFAAFKAFREYTLGAGIETQRIGGQKVEQLTCTITSNNNGILLDDADKLYFISGGGENSDTSFYYLDCGCGGSRYNMAAIATRNYVDEVNNNITTCFSSFSDRLNCLEMYDATLDGCINELTGCVSGLGGCVWNYLNYGYWYNLKNALEDSWLPDYLCGCIIPYVEDNITDPIKESVCQDIKLVEEKVAAISPRGVFSLSDDGTSAARGGFTGWLTSPEVLGISVGSYFNINEITIRKDNSNWDLTISRYLKILISNDAGDGWVTAFFSTEAKQYVSQNEVEITWKLTNKLGSPILSRAGNVGKIIIIQTTEPYESDTPTKVTINQWRARTTSSYSGGFALSGDISFTPQEIDNVDVFKTFAPSTAVSYTVEKQDKLIAGENITIENNVISATATAAATWGSIIREPKACVGILQSGGTRTIWDSNYQTVFEINGTTSELRRKTDNGIAEIYVKDSGGTPVAASYVLNSSNATVGKVFVKNDDVEIAGASGSLKVSSSGITANGLDININNCSVIRENINPGEFKVTHYGSNDGFVIKTETPDGGGDVKLIKMFSTNGNDGYFYAFPALSEKNCTETLALRSDVSGLATCVQGCICTMGTLFTAYVQQLAEGASDLEASVQGCIATINSDISKKANSADVYTKTCTNTLLSAKQDKLTAGSNITIENNVISATGGGSGGTTVDAYTKSEVDEFLATKVTGNSDQVAAGADAYVTNSATIAIGSMSKSTGMHSIAVGGSSNATADESLALGDSAYATGASSTAVGKGAIASMESSTAIGHNSGANCSGSVAIGNKAIAVHPNSIVLSSTGNDAYSANANTFNVFTGGGVSGFYVDGTSVGGLIDAKANSSDVYTKTCTDTLLAAKATKSTTLSGYGITDSYTKTCVDTLLSAKQNTLTAGTGITISGNTISATGGSSGDLSAYLEKTCTQIGTNAFANTCGGVSIGYLATSEFAGIAIGAGANSGCNDSISIGENAMGCGLGSISLGCNARSIGSNVISIGACSCSLSDTGVAIGFRSMVGENSSTAIAIGPDSSAIGFGGIAIGCLAKAEKQTIAIGLGAWGCAYSIVLSSCCSVETGGAYSCSVKENSFNVFTGGGYTDFYVDGCSLGNELCSMNTAISEKATVSYVDTEVAKKQDKLTAGTNITIENNVISATGGGGDTSALETRIAALEAALGGYKLVALTQSEYDALTTKDENTLYFIKTA